MQTQIGKALFFIGVIVAIAAAAPFTKWEAITEALDEAKLTGGASGASVDVAPFTGDKDQK